MQKKIKSFTLLDDGYMVIQLAKKQDVDTYMASLIQKNKGLLPCVQDQKAKSKFYYDCRKFVSLTQLLDIYHFHKQEAVQFLQRLFHHIQEVEDDFPIVLEMDCIYVQQDLRTMAIVALPIHEHRNNENDMHAFLHELMQAIHAEDEVHLLGRMALCIRNANVSTYTILQELEKKPLPFLFTLLKFREHQQIAKDIVLRNQLAVEELFASLQRVQEVYKPSVEEKKEIPLQNETVELFASKKVTCYLTDEGGKMYELEGLKSIGRGDDCNIHVDNPAISTHHAMLYVEKDRAYLEDIGSSNGTYINEEALHANQRYLLHHLDVLVFAGTQLIFHKEE